MRDKDQAPPNCVARFNARKFGYLFCGVSLLAFLLALTASALRLASAQSNAQPAAYVFTHVTIVDVAGAASPSDQTVVIQGERVAAVGKTGRVKIPPGAQVIEATGKFLIPGLWDMHVHATQTPRFTELYVANGVTGVRDMFTPMPAIKSLREEMAAGKRTGLRIIAAGRIVDGPQPVWPGSVAVKDADEGRQAVTTVRDEGSDFVKVYSLLSRESYFAIAEEAKRQGMVFAGHVPNGVTVAEASDAGQKSLEHLYGLLLGCSQREAELMKLNPTLSRAARNKALVELDYDEATARALFARLVKNRTWLCPTLTVLRSMSLLDDPQHIADPRLKYLPPFFRNFWNPQNDFRLKANTAEDWQLAKRIYEKNKALVGKLHKAGVGLLAGTDVMNPFCFPGFSLHDELALLVEAGLTPLEALQTATLNPARYLGLEKTLGTIEVGKSADLVLLDANPLQEIRNTRKINAVVVNGKLYPQTALQKMFDEAAAASNPK